MFRPAKKCRNDRHNSKKHRPTLPQTQVPLYLTRSKFLEEFTLLNGGFLWHNYCKNFGFVQNSLKGYNDPMYTGLI